MLRQLLIIFLISFIPSAIFAQANSKLEKRLTRTIKEESHLKVDKVNSLLVFYKDSEIEGQFLINLKADSNQVLDPKKAILLGDISQAWTALALNNLVNEGQVNWSDDINQYIPEKFQNISAITIAELLSHRSGLSKIPNNFGQYENNYNQPYQYYTDTALLTYYQQQDLAKKIGKYHYSFTDYALLQYLLAQKKILIPKIPNILNIGHKEEKVTSPKSYYQFTCAKGIAMTPENLFNLIKELKIVSASYPIFPTEIQKKTNSSYGFHVLERKRKEIALLKSASDGFTILAAFDRNADKVLLIIADAQDNISGLYGAINWFFK